MVRTAAAASRAGRVLDLARRAVAAVRGGRRGPPTHVSIRPRRRAVVACMLGAALPLAWRRRFPLCTVIAVVAAFVIAGFTLGASSEGYVTSVAVWPATHRAAGHTRFSCLSPQFAPSADRTGQKDETSGPDQQDGCRGRARQRT